MKHNIKSLIGFTIGATDGEIGKVKEFYFDDETWTIRYLIVETGNWLFGRKVLIAPIALSTPDWENKIFPINLTKDQIKNSPDIDTERPVSRQQELEMYAHYPWGNYWGNSLYGGVIPPPVPMDKIIIDESKNKANKTSKGDPHLRSSEKVTGYKIHADYGEIGSVEDFLIDDISWKIDFIVINTGVLLSEKKVLIAPNWIKDIHWDNSEVTVNATVGSIKNSPAYDPSQPFTDEYAESLQKHYGINKKIKDDK